MNIIFAGTPEFSAVTLRALLDSSHQIKAVYTQPDRPAGRGRKVMASAVKELAHQHDLQIHQPITLRNSEEQEKLQSLNADIMIVVAYGLLLPTPVLTAPKLGCLNIHASLLPRWRGAAPIQRSILAGDDTTGITIMQMDEGLDTGNMLYKLECRIEENDTSESLHDKLAKIGAKAILHTLDNLSLLAPEKQDDTLATYAHKIKKEEAVLDFTHSARELSLKIRGFNPWPVAFFGDTRVWQAQVVEQETTAKPGTILKTSSEGIDVATGKGVLRLQKLQFPGGKILSVADILNSHKNNFIVGSVLGSS